jgi:hypothetical protein
MTPRLAVGAGLARSINIRIPGLSIETCSKHSIRPSQCSPEPNVLTARVGSTEIGQGRCAGLVCFLLQNLERAWVGHDLFVNSNRLEYYNRRRLSRRAVPRWSARIRYEQACWLTRGIREQQVWNQNGNRDLFGRRPATQRP